MKTEIEKLIIPADKCESVSAVMYDEGEDELNCSFSNEMCVFIDTKDISYIVLSIDKLNKLKDLILEADAYYKSKGIPNNMPL